jgi:hypothetical protein
MTIVLENLFPIFALSTLLSFFSLSAALLV